MSAVVTPNSNEINLSFDMYGKAHGEKKTFSQWLEEIDPSDKYNSKLDAFERQLQRFGIRVGSDASKGLYAGDIESFYLTQESRVLFPEFVSRVVREELGMSSILPELVAINTPIDSNVYVTFHVADQPAEQSLKRVTEAAMLPVCKIEGQEQSIKLYKYGRAIEASYEVIRRMKIDMLALHVRRIAQQAALDKADAAMDVIINGDGNNNAASVITLTSLGGTVSAGLDYKSWLMFLMKFYPHKGTTFIGGLDEIVKLITIEKPNIDPLVLVSALTQGPVEARLSLGQDFFVNYKALYLPTAPPNMIVGIDRDFAIEQVTEIGSDIMESEKFITKQTNVLTISENNGFGKITPHATKILDLAN